MKRQTVYCIKNTEKVGIYRPIFKEVDKYCNSQCLLAFFKYDVFNRNSDKIIIANLKAM